MFEIQYRDFLKVSFKIIKPKFTKSYQNKKETTNVCLDPLIIHGGSFIDIVKDFYINHYNKAFFEHMCNIKV